MKADKMLFDAKALQVVKLSILNVLHNRKKKLKCIKNSTIDHYYLVKKNKHVLCILCVSKCSNL